MGSVYAKRGSYDGREWQSQRYRPVTNKNKTPQEPMFDSTIRGILHDQFLVARRKTGPRTNERSR